MENDSPFVFAATASSFEASVLERSHEVPVLVDFWAPWCGPCRVLTPILEKCVAAQAGKVLLAKVNTDEQQDLAARFRISGIPAVKAFHKGQVVSEFVGARDGRFVDSFISRLLPKPGEREVSEASSQLAMGVPQEAAQSLRQLLDGGLDGSVKSRAQVLLAESLLLSGHASLAEVGELLRAVDPRSVESDRGEELQAVVDFLLAADEDGGFALATERLTQNERDSAARFIVAAAQARQADFAAALENLLAIVARDRKFRDDGARKAMAALFQLLGPNSELSHDFRRRLQVVV